MMGRMIPPVEADITRPGPPATIDITPENIPEELRERPQWIAWRLERRGEKWTKVPYDPVTGGRASSTDLMSWAAFGEALAAHRAEDYQGVGFVFCSADPFVGIDLDRCRDPETGEVDAEVLDYVRGFKSRYVEASISGTGIHVITTGRLRVGKKVGNREIYGQERFFVMTGVAIDV